MNKFKLSMYVLGLLSLVLILQSCLKDDNSYELVRPTALVTVRPQSDGTFLLQLNDSVVLRPTNMQTSPFGTKQVRALVNYTPNNAEMAYVNSQVQINWIDSIRTKQPVPTQGTNNDSIYGKDALEIVNDWVTVAEDGYLTFRIRTEWGRINTKHILNLLTGVNPDNPYEFELRHDAKGDVGGNMGDALIAFNINDLPRHDTITKAKIKVNWKSFSGNKSAEFNLQFHPK
ncbi:MAG: NigD-like protein [Capnocytophaga sp.]|nr:NigD-like protein [Capnocytophaga sp.]